MDVSAACPVLRAWDLHDDLDSNGAVLFRRFASRALGAVPVAGTPGIYTNQFDANDAVHTPRGLNIANPAVEQSLADAVTDLRDAGIPLDAPLRGWQYERRGSERIPIHGGPGTRRRLQRDQRRLGRLRGHRATRTSRTARAS